MVVPETTCVMEQDVGTAELHEVRKLQELVRRLEVQNQTLRSRGMRPNDNERTEPEGACEDRQESPSHHSSSGDSSGDLSPLPDTHKPETQLETLADQSALDQSALDQVEVLDLEEYDEEEDEDSWLYVSPKKQVQAEQRAESPLKWCRKVLDHPSPETEVACRTLLNRLEQTNRWRNIYSSPCQSAVAEASSSTSALLSPGYHKSTNKTLLTCGNSGCTSVNSALSSQSSIDSELSTSDDSISMGYKLQDLTDVQIMARLQEESLRQDYACSSASLSRRSSSASLQSLRRGTYSDQEFDSYSLEDEEDGCASLASQRLHRYSPSPLSSPRCQSPNTLGPPRARTPRRSLQGPGPGSEEELRHSMPNLAPRSNLRSLEATRNSRSVESNRMTRLPQPSASGTCSTRPRTSGTSALPLRAPVKALGPISNMAGSRQPQVGQGGANRAERRVQSPGPANGGTSTARGTPTTGKSVPARPRPSLGGAVGTTRPKLAQPTRRSLGLTKPCRPVADESWKDGCY